MFVTSTLTWFCKKEMSKMHGMNNIRVKTLFISSHLSVFKNCNVMNCSKLFGLSWVVESAEHLACEVLLK
jgi:hypothetical protein